MAGTQAAAEMLLHPSAIDPILKSATRPDGSLRNFEVLLRSTSIESNATGTQVIASRIYYQIRRSRSHYALRSTHDRIASRFSYSCQGESRAAMRPLSGAG